MKSICLAILLLSTCNLLSASDLTQAEFKKLHQHLQPAKDALWRSIPWKISLLEAQRSANLQKKPIFIWAMDGHPLGCT